MEVNTKCCKKEMIELKNIQNLNSDKDTTLFMCGGCGRFLEISDYSIDEEEYESYFDNHEEIQNTPFHKEWLKQESDLDNDNHELRKVN